MFAGERGPVRDAVLLNAGLALALTGSGLGVDRRTAFDADVRAGMARATEAIDSGAATRLRRVVGGRDPVRLTLLVSRRPSRPRLKAASRSCLE